MFALKIVNLYFLILIRQILHIQKFLPWELLSILSCFLLIQKTFFSDVNGQKKKMQIKEKLLGLKTKGFQKNVFSSILGTRSLDIIYIESYWKKLAFCPVTSQNSSKRYIWKTSHARDLSQWSKIFSVFGRFLERIKNLR